MGFAQRDFHKTGAPPGAPKQLLSVVHAVVLFCAQEHLLGLGYFLLTRNGGSLGNASKT